MFPSEAALVPRAARLAGAAARVRAGGLTANWLKAVALAAMALDHFASGFLCAGSVEWIVLRTLGRLTMPIMCFFVAEGFYHTSNLRRYARRLFCFALLSHLPFTHYFGLDPTAETSVLWGLLLGLLALAVWERRSLPLAVRLLLAALLAALSTPADWGYIGVFWILAFGTLRDRPAAKLWAFTAVGLACYLLPVAPELVQNPAAWLLYGYRLGFLLPIPLLAAYHGAQGRRNPALKWGFYAFYPLHLLILSLLQRF